MKGDYVVGDWTRNFSKAEFACPCCGKLIEADRLAETLQVIRDAVKKPVHVTSGTRCPKHNAEVGGVADSAHLTGEAADIYADGMSNTALGSAIKLLYVSKALPRLCYCYLIANSKRAVHVGVDSKPRKSVFGF